jgi:hypothetical protein
MDWQLLLALISVAAAAGYVGWRAWRAIFGVSKAGCGSACGSCSTNQPQKRELLSIDGGVNSTVKRS